MGDPAPQDDGQIASEEFLYRRVRNDQIFPTDDGNEYRLSSAAWKSHGGPVSVEIGSLISLHEAQNPAGLAPSHVAVISAQNARSQKCWLRKDQDNAGSPAHAHVYGCGPGGSLTGGQAKRLANLSKIILNPNIPPLAK